MQMALERLTTPDDFKDFTEKSDLDAMIKLLLNSAKVAHCAAGTLQEIASYVIPARWSLQDCTSLQVSGLCHGACQYDVASD